MQQSDILNELHNEKIIIFHTKELLVLLRPNKIFSYTFDTYCKCLILCHPLDGEHSQQRTIKPLCVTILTVNV
jgi:hypothetical protein